MGKRKSPSGAERRASSAKKKSARTKRESSPVVESTLPKEPVVVRVVLHDDTPGERVAYVAREGNYPVDRHEAISLKKVILESARYMGHDIPDMFTLKAAEVFYEELKLMKVRLAGEFVEGLTDTGGVRYTSWQTPEKPRFTVSPDYKLCVAEEDQGKAYIAMLNFGEVVWFSWGLSPHFEYDKRPENEVNHYILYFSLVKEESAPRAKKTNAKIRSEAKEVMESILDDFEDVPVESLQEILMPSPPADLSSEQMTIRISDPFRQLSYIYDQEEAMYRLALRYATSVKFDEAEIRELARRDSISFARAKARTLSQHLKFQKAFVEENLAVYHEKSVKVLRDAFTFSLIEEVNTVAIADWKSTQVNKDKSPDELKDLLLAEKLRRWKERVGMTGPGRPELGAEEITKNWTEREEALRQAIRTLYNKAREAGRSEFYAEDDVSFDAVQEELGIKRSSLYERLKKLGLNFEELRGEEIRKQQSS